MEYVLCHLRVRPHFFVSEMGTPIRAWLNAALHGKEGMDEVRKACGEHPLKRFIRIYLPLTASSPFLCSLPCRPYYPHATRFFLRPAPFADALYPESDTRTVESSTPDDDKEFNKTASDTYKKLYMITNPSEMARARQLWEEIFEKKGWFPAPSVSDIICVLAQNTPGESAVKCIAHNNVMKVLEKCLKSQAPTKAFSLEQTTEGKELMGIISAVDTSQPESPQQSHSTDSGISPGESKKSVSSGLVVRLTCSTSPSSEPVSPLPDATRPPAKKDTPKVGTKGLCIDEYGHMYPARIVKMLDPGRAEAKFDNYKDKMIVDIHDKSCWCGYSRDVRTGPPITKSIAPMPRKPVRITKTALADLISALEESYTTGNTERRIVYHAAGDPRDTASCVEKFNSVFNFTNRRCLLYYLARCDASVPFLHPYDLHAIHHLKVPFAAVVDPTTYKVNVFQLTTKGKACLRKCNKYIDECQHCSGTPNLNCYQRSHPSSVEVEEVEGTLDGMVLLQMEEEEDEDNSKKITYDVDKEAWVPVESENDVGCNKNPERDATQSDTGSEGDGKSESVYSVRDEDLVVSDSNDDDNEALTNRKRTGSDSNKEQRPPLKKLKKYRKKAKTSQEGSVLDSSVYEPQSSDDEALDGVPPFVTPLTFYKLKVNTRILYRHPDDECWWPSTIVSLKKGMVHIVCTRGSVSTGRIMIDPALSRASLLPMKAMPKEDFGRGPFECDNVKLNAISWEKGAVFHPADNPIPILKNVLEKIVSKKGPFFGIGCGVFDPAAAELNPKIGESHRGLMVTSAFLFDNSTDERISTTLEKRALTCVFVRQTGFGRPELSMEVLYFMVKRGCAAACVMTPSATEISSKLHWFLVKFTNKTLQAVANGGTLKDCEDEISYTRRIFVKIVSSNTTHTVLVKDMRM